MPMLATRRIMRRGRSEGRDISRLLYIGGYLCCNHMGTTIIFPSAHSYRTSLHRVVNLGLALFYRDNARDMVG